MFFSSTRIRIRSVADGHRDEPEADSTTLGPTYERMEGRRADLDLTHGGHQAPSLS
jgi:hypothetical protein